MKSKIFIVLTIFTVFTFRFASAQDSAAVKQDSIEAKKIKNPKTATYLSLALPGAGQVYNGKYWKVPIVYAGLGALGYSVYFNNYYYKLFLNDMISIQNGDYNTVSGITDWDILKSNKDQARYYRDLSVLGFIIFWGLNAVDAYIDAEFSSFDVSDDLTLYWHPSAIENNISKNYSPAITFGIKF